jgi:2-C-methyl-D-erythritol 4-phosphate cytidylyltransferase
VRALETWAIVLGAGSGDRLGADRPKAFVRFAGGTLIAASLEAFELHPGIDGVVVTIPEGYEEHIGLVADDIGAGKIATAVPGGPSRAESVAIALESLPVSADFVLVHDAARPVVGPDVIDRVLAGLADGADGVVPALEVVDTIKRLGDDGSIAETLVRSALRAVQTPQGFPVTVLRNAVAQAGERLATATDCATLVEWVGGRVVCVDGDARNMKVTHPDDLARAEALVGWTEADEVDDDEAWDLADDE